MSEALIRRDESQVIAEIMQSQHSGGSGLGMSMISLGAECGKRALIAMEQAKSDQHDAPAYFGIGSMYHKMHELWAEGYDLNLNGTSGNDKLAEAYRLFDGWRKHWPRDLYGKPLANELQIPGDDMTAAKIKAKLGAIVTARPDRVVYINESQVADLAHSRGLVLPCAGEYIIDFKTASQKGEDLAYTEGLQALWYPLAYEIQTMHKVEGVIFDIIYKFPRRSSREVTRENFHAVFAPHPGLQGWDELQGLVQQCADNMARAQEFNVGNRASCVKWGMYKPDVCPFRSGLCDGA